MRLKTLLLILVTVLCVNPISAQKNNKKITITGTVKDASGFPIGNAIVMIDGNNTSTMTDSKGAYMIKVKPTAQKIGIFTFGSGIKEETIEGRSEINFNFGTSAPQQQSGEKIKPGDEAVNTGYGYVKKKDVITEVGKTDETKNKYATYNSVYEIIEREISGVKVQGTSVIILGSKDFFGSVPALLVVDGTYVDDLSSISPATVESIEVLKGAAAAMYGSRGYGGAVVIKTKIKN